MGSQKLPNGVKTLFSKSPMFSSSGSAGTENFVKIGKIYEKVVFFKVVFFSINLIQMNESRVLICELTGHTFINTKTLFKSCCLKVPPEQTKWQNFQSLQKRCVLERRLFLLIRLK